MKLQGKTIVVTGGASGIGRGLVERFRREGAANIVIADINAEELEPFAAQVGGTPLVCDVSREDQVKDLVAFTEDTFGQIDLFCGNAGILIRGGVEASSQVWEKMWAVNVMAHVYAIRHALPAMLQRGEGYFLITASAAGLLSQLGSAPYSVTKHAALALAEWIQITHGAQGIKVSALCPQAVESKMTAGATGAAFMDGLLSPGEVAEVVVNCLAEERFLVLPHPSVEKYFQSKARNYQHWLAAMQGLQEQFGQ